MIVECTRRTVYGRYSNSRSTLRVLPVMETISFLEQGTPLPAPLAQAPAQHWQCCQSWRPSLSRNKVHPSPPPGSSSRSTLRVLPAMETISFSEQGTPLPAPMAQASAQHWERCPPWKLFLARRFNDKFFPVIILENISCFNFIETVFVIEGMCPKGSASWRKKLGSASWRYPDTYWEAQKLLALCFPLIS